MRMLIKFKDGLTVDTKDMGDNTFIGNTNFLEQLQEYKKDPNAVFELEGKLLRKFSEIYSIEIILD